MNHLNFFLNYLPKLYIEYGTCYSYTVEPRYKEVGYNKTRL